MPPWYRTATPQGARRAIEQIRASIGIYRWVPVLSMISAVLLAVVAATAGSTVISAGLGQSITVPSANNTANATTVVSGGAAVVSGVSSLLGLVSLILTIVAWVSWRSGVRQLRNEIGTPWSPPAAVDETNRYYVATIGVFVANVVAVIAIVIVVIGEVIASVASGPGSGTSSPGSLADTLRLTVAAAIAIAGGLSVAMYACAGTSLRAPLRPLLALADAARIDRARWLLVLGAALTWAALLAYINPWLVFATVAGPALLLFGLQEFRGVYGDWLSHNPSDLSSLPPLSPSPSPLAGR